MEEDTLTAKAVRIVALYDFLYIPDFIHILRPSKQNKWFRNYNTSCFSMWNILPMYKL